MGQASVLTVGRSNADWLHALRATGAERDAALARIPSLIVAIVLLVPHNGSRNSPDEAARDDRSFDGASEAVRKPSLLDAPHGPIPFLGKLLESDRANGLPAEGFAAAASRFSARWVT